MLLIETPNFTNRVGDLLSEDDYYQLQDVLAANPAFGSVIIGGGGIRKIRWAAKGRGKRGGARVIYYWAVSQEQILLLDIFAKNEKADLSKQELEILRRIVEEEYR